MKNFILNLILFCCSYSVFSQENKHKLEADLSIGQQNNNFHWSIAGNSSGQNPNVFSELKWNKIKSISYNAALQWNFYKRFLLSASYSNSVISSGTVNDIDYQADNRKNQVYNQTFSANKGNAIDMNAGFGYQLFASDDYILSSYLGYTLEKQFLNLLGNTPSGTLNSSYNSTWSGIYFKLNSDLRIINKLKLSADIIYSQVNYNANANWNLINEFAHPVSFTHYAKGFGINADAKFTYQLFSQIGIYLGGGYFSWQSGKGIDQLYLASGQIANTQLNEAVNKGYSLFTGLSLCF